MLFPPGNLLRYKMFSYHSYLELEASVMYLATWIFGAA